MRIGTITIDAGTDSQCVSARIGPLTLWFRFPRAVDVDVTDASPFLVAALAPAMLLGEDLDVEAGLFVSPRLLAATDAAQTLLETWNPVFKRVRIKAEARETAASNGRVAAFFSGGVDGTYTLLSHQEEIEDLILINGFDFTMEKSTWCAMVERNRAFANSRGKVLVAVETNFKSFTAAFGIARLVNYGAVLATVALLLRYRHVHLSAAETYRLLHPGGSHALLDGLWSTESTTISHTGLEADRAGKLARIVGDTSALANLWVCWKDPRRNCGRCSKCIRTAMALEVIGAEAPIFDAPPGFRDYRRIRIRKSEDVEYFSQFLDAARANGRPRIARLLQRRLLAYRIHAVVRDLLDYVMAGRGERLLRRLRPPADQLVDISVFPRYSDDNVMRIARRRIHAGEMRDTGDVPGSIYR